MTGTAHKQCAGNCRSVQGDNGTSIAPQAVLITRPTLQSNSSILTGVPSMVFVDAAGHALRHETWGFDGSEIDTDQNYDAWGREHISYSISRLQIRTRFEGGSNS